MQLLPSFTDPFTPIFLSACSFTYPFPTGVRIEMSPAQVAQSVAECGVGFMYAPMNHPMMKVVAPVRKALGVRTAFNLLGPMTNAANAQHVVIGVFEESLVELMARTLMGKHN